jgi:hypothetical protein
MCKAANNRKPPSKLNKSRTKKKRLPYFEYKVLKVNRVKKEACEFQGRLNTSGRRSPRQHHRRGHVRKIPSKQCSIWINDTIVGRAANGIIKKEYLLFQEE